jgi:glycosyltransferase involved in cell wall biosynthesis
LSRRIWFEACRVIASDLAAFVEALGGTGQLFRTGDAADLALQMGRILDDPALGQRFAAAARQRIQETFAEQRMTEGHSRIYQKLLRTVTAVHTDIPREP